MLIIYLLQVLVPLALIFWIAFSAARDLFSFCCEVTGVSVLLVTLIFTGIWIIPPWWTPYAFIGLTFLAILFALRRSPRFVSIFPPKAKNWLGPLVFLTLTLVCLSQLLPALRGRTLPLGAIALDYPLGSGSYLIVSGGNHSTINSHFMTLDEDEPRFAQWRGQSYALDIVKVDKWGTRSSGIMPADPSNYFIFGTEVMAPCSGTVTRAVNDVADNRVPTMNRRSMSGNHVVISCNGVEVLIAHLLQNSVQVSRDDQVRVGDILGLAGNSGNSGEPHLHIHAQSAGAPAETLDTNPLPLTIAGEYWVRNQIMVVP